MTRRLTNGTRVSWVDAGDQPKPRRKQAAAADGQSTPRRLNTEEYRMQTSEVLNLAADLIEKRGWSQGTGWYPEPDSTHPVCLEGALSAATTQRQIKDGHCAAYEAVKEYLTSTRPEERNPVVGYVIPFAWNDRPRRTAAEVIEVLRAVAVIEAARESKAVEVSA